MLKYTTMSADMCQKDGQLRLELNPYQEGDSIKMPSATYERDPNGLDQHEPGAKNDFGKPDASLLLMFGKALRAVAGVGTFGAEKYTRGGWQHVENGRERYTAAMLRHVFEEEYELLDSDSGLYHDAHAAWNALARLELRIRESST